MKYIILVCDGAADWPIKNLGNKTPFEVANTPSMDWLASHGKMGLLRTVPETMDPGSAVANLTIMGYKPERDFTGRGPLEALSSNVPMNKTDLVFRCNLITIEEGLIKDYSSGHISTEEGRTLIQYIDSELKQEGVDFFPGVQYRHILWLDGKKFSEMIKTTPPHDQLDKPFEEFLPTPIEPHDKLAKNTAESIIKLIQKSNKLLLSHEVNINRKKKGKLLATHIWPWGGGKNPRLIPLNKKFGLTGAVISAVDLIFGIGVAAGLEPIHVEGATGLPDTNYQGKVDAALIVLKEKDFVFLHIEATDEMGHTGDPQNKIAAIEAFDQKIVTPILNSENDFNNELVIVVLPDHPTPCKIRTHSKDPVPFVIFNPQKDSNVKPKRNYSEKSGKEGELGLIEDGEHFIRLMMS